MTTYINPGNNTGLYGINDININVPYGNANVETFLAVGSDDGGNVVGNITAVGNITGSYFIGNGSQLTGIGAAYSNADVSTYLASGTNTANIVTTGNISGTYVLGNGSQLTGLPAVYSNAQVSTYLASGTNSANIVTTGNVSGTYVLGNGSQLTGLPATYSNAQVSTYLASGTNTANIATTGNVIAGRVQTGTIVDASGPGNSLIVSAASNPGAPVGNITAGNITATAELSAAGNIISSSNISGGNITTGGRISAAGNITGSYIIGNGSLLSNISAGNIVGAYGNANVSTYLASGTNTANIVTTANIAGGNIKTGNITIGTDTIRSANSTMTLDPASDGVSGLVVIAGNLQVTGTTTTVDSTTVTINDLMLNVANNAATSSAANGGGLGVGPVGSEYAKLSWDSAGNTWDSTHGISAVGTVTATSFSGSGAGLTGISVSSIQNGTSNVTIPGSGANIELWVAAVAGQPAMQISQFTGEVDINSSLRVEGPLTVVTGTGTISAVGNITGANLRTAGSVSATGNLIGNNISVSSASVTGNITSGNLTTTGLGTITSGNLVTAPYIAAGTRMDANVLYTNGLVDVGGELAVAGNILAPLSRISGGNLSASGIGAGFITASANISATGNISGNYFIGNGSQLTGLPAAYTDSNVTTFLSSGTNAGNMITTGNISGNYYIGNGSLLTGITATYTDSNVTTFLASGTNTGNMITTGNISGNYYIGNGSLLTGLPATYADSNVSTYLASGTNTANIITTGNISGNYYIGNGSLLTGITATVTPGGSDSQIQYNNGGALGGNALMTFNDTTGNIALANVKIAGTQIENTSAYAIPSTAVNPGRLVIGNGYDGDISVTPDFLSRNRNAHLAIWNKNSLDNVAGQTTGLTVQQHTVANAALTNNQARTFAGASILQIGGGATNNAWSQTLPFAINAQGAAIQIGNVSGALIGNTAVTTAVATGGSITVAAGSSIGNAFGFIAAPTVAGTMNTHIAFAGYNQYTAGGSIGESILLYNPNGNGAYNTAQAAQFRQATNGYWCIKNDDDVATNKMGSLKQYHESTYALATSGALTIDKANGQVQTLAPSAAMSIAGFSNFVTAPSNGATTVSQADTVTVIVQQGATGYAVTLPAASSSIKYAAGASTVATTANSVTMISITAINNGGTPLYLITVSPGFV